MLAAAGFQGKIPGGGGEVWLACFSACGPFIALVLHCCGDGGTGFVVNCVAAILGTANDCFGANGTVIEITDYCNL